MAVQTGNAESHSDLLNKAKIFILANGGTQHRYVTSTPGQEEFIFELAGGGTDEIIMGMRCFSDSATDNFAWELQGFTGFNSSLSFHQQPGAISGFHPCLPLVDPSPTDTNAIKYWFILSSRRFMCIAKVSNIYHQCYLGFILPYSVPTVFPYPLFVGGSTFFQSNPFDAQFNKPYRFSDTTHKTTAFWRNRDLDNNVGTGCLRDGGGVYQRFVEKSNNTNNASGMTGTWPYMEAFRDDYGGYDNFRPCIDGTYSLQPIMLCHGISVNMYGELDGMKHLSGSSLAAEDIVEIGADDYLCIPNVFRNDVGNFCVYKYV